jgi:hypothetical protein
MATGHNVRVGDADREAVAAQLREHFADGRLTLDELNERLDEAFAAKTKADLNTVMRELPQATRPTADAPFGGVRGTAWQGPAWPPMAARSSWDYSDGNGDRGGQRGPRGRWGPGAFAPVMGLVWMFIILGSLFLFGFGGGGRPLVIVVLIAALALVRRLFGLGWRRGRGGPWGPGGPRGRRRC